MYNESHPTHTFHPYRCNMLHPQKEKSPLFSLSW